jgi:hypothetical protein
MSKSLRDLVPVVLDKTRDRKIPWKPESVEVFSADLGSNQVLVIYENDIDIVLSLRGKGSTELESVDTDGETPSVKQGLRSLYSLVRRQALGVDKAIEDVEKTLLSL